MSPPWQPVCLTAGAGVNRQYLSKSEQSNPFLCRLSDTELHFFWNARLSEPVCNYAIPHNRCDEMAMQTNPENPRILIIENEFLIADMVHDMVLELGYDAKRPVHRFPSALREIDKENFDCALVNVGIDAAKHGIEIADLLKEHGVPFGFVTGYNHALAKRHADVPLLQKPFSTEQLRAFLESLVGPPRNRKTGSFAEHPF
jgi:CheY-like chemotaxis protein